MRVRILLLFALFLLPTAAAADSLEITYPAVERMVITGLLTEGGRRYLHGSPSDTCNYAFVQEPRVTGVSGRLNVRFLFAGSIGAEVAGRCVGRGDNFNIVVSGVPRYDRGDIVLDQVRFEADNPLWDLFSPIIKSRLGPMLRLPLRQGIESRLASSGAMGRASVEDLTVSNIHVGERTVRIDAGLRIVLGP